MSIQSIIAIVGLGIVVLSNLIGTVWWAAKVTYILETVNQTLLRLDKELEKRDERMDSVWKRIDELRDMIGK